MLDILDGQKEKNRNARRKSTRNTIQYNTLQLCGGECQTEDDKYKTGKKKIANNKRRK